MEKIEDCRKNSVTFSCQWHHWTGTMLAAPKAFHCHRLHLNKMRFVVTEGVGDHCVVDLGHFNENSFFFLPVSWNYLLEASQMLHFGLTVQPLASILSSLPCSSVSPPSQPGVISHLYIISLDMEVPQDMCCCKHGWQPWFIYGGFSLPVYLPAYQSAGNFLWI